MEKIVHDLPQELITDILLRLPVKSLLRFKCVSKSWFSLISNPHFTSSHYDLQASRIVLFAASASEFRSVDVDASLHDDATLSLNFVPPQLHYKVKIMGSCRGFLLLECSSNLCIWNPSTGVHRQIPHRQIPHCVDARILKIFYGFGYNPSTDDYLVFIASSEFKFLATLPVHMELYSLRGNTWDDINNTSFSYMLIAYNGPKVGFPLNGAIHWLAYGFNEPSYIVTFDLTERNFSKIPLPPIQNFGYDFKRCDLGILGGFLSLYVVGWNEYEPAKIWVMKEYKMQSSWTKTILVSNHHIPSFSPLCFTKIGDIVGRDEYLGLVKCDDKGQVKEHRSIYSDYSFRFQVAVYTDSLFSLPGDNNRAEEEVTSPRLNCSWYTCMFEPWEWVKKCWRKLVFSP